MQEAGERAAGNAIWTALAAGGAVALVRLCGEGLYDRRRQNPDLARSWKTSSGDDLGRSSAGSVAEARF